jgi:hypothetical protein
MIWMLYADNAIDPTAATGSSTQRSAPRAASRHSAITAIAKPVDPTTSNGDPLCASLVSRSATRPLVPATPVATAEPP